MRAARAGVTALENGETYAATAAVSDARSVLLDWRRVEAKRALDEGERDED